MNSNNYKNLSNNDELELVELEEFSTYDEVLIMAREYMQRNLTDYTGFYDLMSAEMNRSYDLTIEDIKKIVLVLIKGKPVEVQIKYKKHFNYFAKKYENRNAKPIGTTKTVFTYESQTGIFEKARTETKYYIENKFAQCNPTAYTPSDYNRLETVYKSLVKKLDCLEYTPNYQQTLKYQRDMFDNTL